MPDYSSTEEYQAPDVIALGSATSEQHARAADFSANREYGAFGNLGRFTVTGAIDLIDTMATSIPGVSRATGYERGKLSDKMFASIDMPGLTRFYNEHKEGTQVTSAIYGVIAAELATRRLAAAAKPFVAGLKTLPFARRIATLDTQYDLAMAGLRAADASIAARGLTSAKELVAAATVPVAKWTPTGLTTELATFGRNQLATKARLLGAAKGARSGLATELTMAATLNQNEILYSEDYGSNALWMAAGIGVPALFDTFLTNYSIKKFVASDAVNRIRAGALDPTGLERESLIPAGARPVKDESRYLGKLQGARTDAITSLMVQADAAIPMGVDSSAFNTMTIAKKGQAFTEAEKVTQKGVGVPGTGFVIGKGEATTPHGRALKATLGRDAGGLHGVEMAGRPVEGETLLSTHEQKVARVSERQTELRDRLHKADYKTEQERIGMLSELKALNFNEATAPGIVVDGERLPMSQASVYDNWEPPKIEAKLFANRPLWEAKSPEGKAFGLGIDGDLNILISKGRTLEQLDYLDAMRLHRVANRTTKSLAARALKDDKFKIQLGNKPTWMQLDMADEIADLTDGAAQIYYPKGMSRETAQVESFAQKVDAIKQMTDGMTQEMLEKELPRLRSRFNLPRLTAYQMGTLGTSKGPADVIVRGAIQRGGGDAVRAMSPAELKESFAQAQKIADLSNMSGQQVKTVRGTSFNFLLDDAGNELSPILVYSRTLKPHQWSKADLADRIATHKIQQAKMLMGPVADDFTRSLTSAIFASPDLDLAMKVSNMTDQSLTAGLPGMGNVAPQSQLGANLNQFKSTEWIARDQPNLQAVTRLREQTDRMARAWMKESFESAFGDALSAVAGPRSLQTRTLLDQFHSPGMSAGWDLGKGTVEVQTGLHGFVLEKTARNAKRFEEQFGRKMKDGELLLSPAGKPIVLDDLGLDVQRRFNTLTDQRRKAGNSLLRAQGLPEIHHSSWYVLPPNLEGKFVAMTQGVDGKFVRPGTFIANTQRQLDSMIEAAKANPNHPASKAGNIVRGRKEIEDFGTLWDKQQMDMIDANLTVVQGGKTNVGGTAQFDMVSGAFQSSVTGLRDQFLRHGSDLFETIMDESIKSAKMRSHLAVGETKSRSSFFRDVQGKSVFDYWLQEVKGQTPLSSTSSPVGPIYNKIEDNFNKTMQEAAPSASKVYHAATDWLTKRFPWSQEVADKEGFEKLSTHLGKYMPFDDVAQMMANKGAGANPFTLAEVTGGINKLTSTWMLRMGETGHPIMNMAGIVNAMPSVVNHYMPKAGETVAEHAQRVGHSATIFNTPSGKTIGVLNMGKLALRGFQRAWSRQSDAAFTRLANKGFLSQEVAEFQRQFNAADSVSGMQKFLNGDQTIKNPKGVGQHLASKGLVGWLSVLSDKSEDFSRSWAHFIGEELGTQLGIKNVDALDNFAHDIANKTIANYSPHNRPEIFQGAVGAPFGLFQSYMYNYWQRIFRYIETGDMRSLATQYAMQGSLFGAKTVPGFEQINALFFSASDGETSPYDTLVSKFGPDMGDLLMAGTLSNLPKLFGAEGVDFVSRGDVSPRLPGAALNAVTGGEWAQLIPGLAVLKKVKDGLGQAWDLTKEQTPQITSQEIGEIASNSIPNRPLAGLIETFMAGGKDTDSYGQLVNENTEMGESVYRMMGLRSLRQSKELEAFYNNKQAMEIKAGQDDVLRESSRAMIRAGKADVLPDIFQTYVLNGGDTRNFRRWYLDNVESATTTRGQRQLEDTMRDPDKASQMQRLLDAEVSLQEDEATEDPYASLSVTDPMDDPVNPVPTEDDDGASYGAAWQPQPQGF